MFFSGLVALKNSTAAAHSSHDLAFPLPVTLFPTKFPRKQFELAIGIQESFNQLIHLISQDYDFLKEVLKK